MLRYSAVCFLWERYLHDSDGAVMVLHGKKRFSKVAAGTRTGISPDLVSRTKIERRQFG